MIFVIIETVHARDYAYYGVLGFLLVSVGLVLPGFESGNGLWVDLLMLLLGVLGALWLSRLAQDETGSVNL